MDRNSLLAFLLIAVIIFLIPEYYKLVYPPPPDTDSLFVYKEEQIRAPLQPNENITTSLSFVKQEEAAKSFTINTNLYTAEISTINGGSIASLVLLNHALNDTESVDLIDNKNANNLLVRFRSIDGDDISLSGGWITDNDYDINVYENQTTVTFRKIVAEKQITKALTFYPDKYIIDMSVDLSAIHNFVSRGISTVSWAGGLPLTEPNKKDEQIYYKAVLFQGDETYTPKTQKPSKAKLERMEYPTDWVAIRTKYFIMAMVPKKQAPGSEVLAIEENGDISYNVGMFFDVNRPFLSTLYIGPLEYNRIKRLGNNLDQIMNFGWAFIRPISKGVHWFLLFLYNYIPNYGFVLLVFSVAVKILVYPLTKKSYVSTKKMQAVQPMLNDLREKYKNDQRKFAQVQMNLFKEHGVNPLSGCVPILLQMPLLFALFTVFRSSIELRGAPFILWIKDLSRPDAVFDLGINVPLYGSQVAILPILMGVTMFIQMKSTPTPQSGGQQKFMMYFMNGFFVLIFNQFPSGLVLYYTLFNILTVLQQKYLIPQTNLKGVVNKKSV
jgi:YidC/Oxa1 family membrane protein insertase